MFVYVFIMLLIIFMILCLLLIFMCINNYIYYLLLKYKKYALLYSARTQINKLDYFSRIKCLYKGKYSR